MQGGCRNGCQGITVVIVARHEDAGQRSPAYLSEICDQLIARFALRNMAEVLQQFNGLAWNEVPAEQVADFLDAYQAHPGARKVKSKLLAEFVREMSSKSKELTSWTVALMDSGRANVLTDKVARTKNFKPREINGKIVRLEVMDTERLSRAHPLGVHFGGSPHRRDEAACGVNICVKLSVIFEESDGFKELPAERELQALGGPHFQGGSHEQHRMRLHLEPVFLRCRAAVGHRIELLAQLFGGVGDVPEPFDQVLGRVKAAKVDIAGAVSVERIPGLNWRSGVICTGPDFAMC